MFKSFKHFALLSDISNLVFGILFAQLIPLLLQPVLKRIFTPEDFGAFDYYYKIVSILVIIMTLKYESSIVLPKSEKDAFNQLILCFIIGLIVTGFCEILVLINNSLPINIIWIPEKIKGWLYLIPISAFFFEMTNSLNYYLMRYRKFRSVSINKIIRRLTEGIVQAPLGLLFKNTSLLPIGDMIGNIGSFMSGLFILFKNNLLFIKDLSLTQMKKGLSIYSDLPKFTLIPNLLNVFVLSSLTFQTLKNFSLTEVGYLELTQKLLMIPSALIASSVSKVVLQRVAKASANNISFYKELRIVFFILTAITIGFSVIIVFFAPQLFSFVFGKEWLNSGYYARILIFYTGVSFVISPLGQVLIGLKKFKLNSSWEIIKFVFIGSLYFVEFSDINNYLKIFSIINILLYLLYGIFIYKSIIRYEQSIIQI